MQTGLAPEHRFPAAPIDCIECYRSVIEDYGVDPKKIIMGILLFIVGFPTKAFEKFFH